MAVLYVVSAVGCAFAWSWTALVIFRFIGGLGIGGSSVLGPMYIAEISPAKWRGRLVGFFQFNVVLGILLAYLSNYAIGTLQLGAVEWRWKLGISVLPAVFFLAMLFGIPRSRAGSPKRPHWRSSRRSPSYRRTNYEAELQEIVASIDAEHHQHDSLWNRQYRLPVFPRRYHRHVQPTRWHQRHSLLLEPDLRRGRLQQSLLGPSIRRHRRHQSHLHHDRHDPDRQSRPQKASIDWRRRYGYLPRRSRCHLSHAPAQRYLVWLLVTYIAFFAFSQGAVIWVYIGEGFPQPHSRPRAKALAASLTG